MKSPEVRNYCEYIVPPKHNVALTLTNLLGHNRIIAKKRGVAFVSLVSIRPYKCFSNTQAKLVLYPLLHNDSNHEQIDLWVKLHLGGTLYDSLLPQLSNNSQQQIACIMNIDGCGIFAIVFATILCLLQQWWLIVDIELRTYWHRSPFWGKSTKVVES